MRNNLENEEDIELLTTAEIQEELRKQQKIKQQKTTYYNSEELQ